MPFFESLVDRFYAGVASDPGLLRLYPEPDDLSGARHRLTLFLAQYWGGPTTYNDERGHPRLRMRHVPFAIGAAFGAVSPELGEQRARAPPRARLPRPEFGASREGRQPRKPPPRRTTDATRPRPRGIRCRERTRYGAVAPAAMLSS